MIHRYTLKGKNFLLDVNSGSVHLLDNVTYAVSGLIGEDMEKECPADLPAKLPDYAPEEIQEAYGELWALKEAGMLFAKDDYIDVSRYIPAGAPVKALCLHVAHDCNLRCEYCFASTGDFGTGRKIMPFEVAKKAIDFVIKRSGARKNIEVDFFGGEPLMAMETVKKTVEYARSLEPATGKQFRFTITTNGLLLEEESIRYINETMNNVVLSLDGRKAVNDTMRKTVNGTGSYDVILPRFQDLVSKRDKTLDYFVRGTFTKENLDFAEDVQHIAEAGFDRLSVEPVAAEAKYSYALSEEDLPRIYAEYERLCDFILDKHNKGEDLSFFHFMVDLEQGPCVIKRLRGCGAGYEYVAVTPEGDIYPCHQFVGNPAYRQGSVLEDTLDDAMAQKFAAMNIYTREQCRDCWAKFYCSGGCSAANYLMNGDLQKPYHMGCEMEKKRLECAIYLKAAMQE